MATIKIYTTTTCPFCHMAKEYFKEKGLNYEEINLTQNPERIQEMIQISGQMGVPVIVIDGRVIIGFNKHEIDKNLGI